MTHVSIVPNDLGVETPQNKSTPSRTLRLLRLPHPRTHVPSLFLPYSSNPSRSTEPSSAILEVQAVAPHSCRSWFLDQGRVIEDGKLLVMTPIDPIFLLLPILQAAQPADGSLGRFRRSDDIFEEAAARLSAATKDSKGMSIQESDIMALASLDCVHGALRRICDVKDLTDDISVYRFSRAVLLETLRDKVMHLSKPGTFDTFPSLHRGLARDGLLGESKEELRQAGRTRASCETLSQYLSPDVTKDLTASYNFTALDTHIQSLSDGDITLPPARSIGVSQEMEPDNKRKAPSQLSKGVSKLMKVNTSGMAKISTFFKKSAK